MNYLALSRVFFILFKYYHLELELQKVDGWLEVQDRELHMVKYRDSCCIT